MRRADRPAGVAQLAERLICNQQVKGSSPLASSNPSRVRNAERLENNPQKSAGEARTQNPPLQSAPFAGEVSGRPKPLAQRADRTEDFGRASRRLSERREAGTGSTAARTARCLSMDLCSLVGVGAPYLTRTHQEREIEEAQRGLPGCERRVRAERYRSGQTGQTVNLLANAFGGSNPPLSTTRASSDGQHCKEMAAAANEWTAGIAQLARARAFQARGRGFESRFPLQLTTRERDAHVAQSVEHVLGKDEVTGSIPVVGSSSWIQRRRNSR